MAIQELNLTEETNTPLNTVDPKAYKELKERRIEESVKDGVDPEVAKADAEYNLRNAH